MDLRLGCHPRRSLLLLFFGRLSAINRFFTVEILELGQSHIGKQRDGWLLFAVTATDDQPEVLKR
jgi:hypothetical protein